MSCQYLTSEDFNKAVEALKKARIDPPYWTVIPPDPIPMEDTYTLIPNGEEFTDTQGYDKIVKINSYLVQHDQTGNTIKWCGCSSDHYYDYYACYDPKHNPFKHFYPFLEKSPKRKKKWKEAELKRIKRNMLPTPNYVKNYSLDDCVKYDCIPSPTCAPTATTQRCAKYNPYQKEEVMAYASANISAATPTDQRQRDYLLERLDSIARGKEKDFYTTFKLDPVKSPRSMKELVEKIKSGDYTMQYDLTEDTKFCDLGDLSYNIRWTKEKADRDGYDKACAALKKGKQATKDLIIISEPKEGLAALNEFEAKTFH